MWWSQMVSIPLPQIDLRQLSERLLKDHNIEVPIFSWRDHPLTRLSIQAYNTPEEVDTFIEAIRVFAEQRQLAT
jgi:isopenicillin-N epimerase